MNLATGLAMLLVGAEGGGAGGAPDGDPTSVSLYYYGGSNIGVQWVNGDSEAYTDVGSSGSSGSEPASVTATVDPGETQYETGTSGTIGFVVSGTYWWVRHRKNGQTGDWVVSAEGVE